MGSTAGNKSSIRGWHGLLGDVSKKACVSIFIAISILSGSMTFIQMGFVGIGSGIEYGAYLMALLAPIACAALLLGKGWGTLEGILSGAVLYTHAQILPLDIVERYIVSIASSVILFGVVGLLLGLFFAIALRKNPQGIRRIVYLVLCCAIVSLLATTAFLIFGIAHILTLESLESVVALIGTGSPEIQAICDFALMLVFCLLCDRAVTWYKTASSYVNVRTLFRVQLIVALCLAYIVTSAVAFVAITMQAAEAGKSSIYGELTYLEKQFNHLSNAKESASAESELEDGFEYGAVIDGYEMSDGTVLVVRDGKIAYSYNPGYVAGKTIEECFGISMTEPFEKMANERAMKEMLYNDNSNTVQLSYMGAVKPFANEDLYITFAKPFYMIYGSRSSMMFWISLIVFVLLVIVYILADHILRRIVGEPIERTNESLAKISDGDLDVLVTETNSIEFSLLSAGINTTVDALKRLIDEAERRNEQDLITARAIQEGALPKVFPAFPGVESVDLFASMDAAKEVGGDFYDFFEVSDNAVGFLIADVSGKGIPGALFMMAAKNEIENQILSGKELSEAVSAANAHLCANNEAGMFVTMWAAIFDWSTGELTYVNAGHNFPLLRHGQDGAWEWLKKKCGLFLGTFEMAKYRQETLVLQPGDELVLYTDGVNEAFSIDDEEYGNDRLDAFLAAHNNLRPKELAQSLRADVAAWAEGAEQSDDVTVLVVEYSVSA